MPCSTKCIAGFSVAAIVACFVCAILGIVIMTSSVPINTCGGGIVRLSQNDQDNIDAALLWLGAPALAGGIIGVIGGGFGGFGGFKANKCGLCSAATLNGISGGFLVIAALSAAALSAAFAAVCDDYMCDSAPVCANIFSSFASETLCKSPDVCCKCEGMALHTSCKESVDWTCEMKTKKLIVMLGSVVGLILAITSSSLACGASCCCPTSFTEMAEIPAGVPPANAMVVGQVVGNDQGK